MVCCVSSTCDRSANAEYSTIASAATKPVNHRSQLTTLLASYKRIHKQPKPIHYLYTLHQLHLGWLVHSKFSKNKYSSYLQVLRDNNDNVHTSTYVPWTIVPLPLVQQRFDEISFRASSWNRPGNRALELSCLGWGPTTASSSVAV